MTPCFNTQMFKIWKHVTSSNAYHNTLAIANHFYVYFASPVPSSGTLLRSFKCGTFGLLWAACKTQGRKYSENRRHLSSWLPAFAGMGLFSGEGTKAKQVCREELFRFENSTGSVHAHHLFMFKNLNKICSSFGLELCFILGNIFCCTLPHTDHNTTCNMHDWSQQIKFTDLECTHMLNVCKFSFTPWSQKDDIVFSCRIGQPTALHQEC